jgi:hypothetical protein
MKITELVCILLIVLSGFGAGCASQVILNDRPPADEPAASSTPEAKIDDFEARLSSVQTGNFEFVYVFRRRDGEAFSSDDKRLFRETTVNVNQRQLTADDKALIIGSNYAFPPETLELLKNEFKFEDYSPKKEEPKTEQNSNLKVQPKKDKNSNVNR